MKTMTHTLAVAAFSCPMLFGGPSGPSKAVIGRQMAFDIFTDTSVQSRTAPWEASEPTFSIDRKTLVVPYTNRSIMSVRAPLKGRNKGLKMVGTGPNGFISLYEARTGKLIREIPAESRMVSIASLSPDQTLLVTNPPDAKSDDTVTRIGIVSALTGRLQNLVHFVNAESGKTVGWITSVTISRDGTRALVKSLYEGSFTVSTADLFKKPSLFRTVMTSGAPDRDIPVLPISSSRAILLANNGVVAVNKDFETRREISVFDARGQLISRAPISNIESDLFLAANRDGSLIAIAPSSYAGRNPKALVDIIDRSGQVVKQIDLNQLGVQLVGKEIINGVDGLLFDDDGRTIAFEIYLQLGVNRDRIFAVVDLASGLLISQKRVPQKSSFGPYSTFMVGMPSR